MKVLVSIGDIRAAGGAGVYTTQVIRAMEDRGWEVALLTSNPQGLDGIRCFHAGRSSLPLDGIRQWGPDLYFSQGWPDLLQEQSLLKNYPSFYLAHDHRGMCVSGHKSWWFPNPVPCTRPLGLGCLAHYFPHRCGGMNPVTLAKKYREQTAYSNHIKTFKGVVALSGFMVSSLRKQGVEASHVPFWPEVTPLSPPSEPTHPILGFAGRIDARKGLEAMVRAISGLDVPGLGVEIIGAGDFVPTLDRLTHKHWGDRVGVTRLGWMDRSKLLKKIQHWSVMVFPSQWPEPLGLAGMEAISLGTPVAAFDVGGISEWLRNGENGFLAPGNPPTASGLNKAIESCLRMKRVKAPKTPPTPDRHVAKLERVFQKKSLQAE